MCLYKERVCVSNLIHTHAHTHTWHHQSCLATLWLCDLRFLPFYYSHMPFERAIKERAKKKKYQIQIICDKISHKTTHWHIRIHTYTHGSTSIGVRKHAKKRKRERERRMRETISRILRGTSIISL